MRTFAVSMTLLVAGLVGSGYYAYNLGVGQYAGAKKVGGENQPGAAESPQPGPSGQTMAANSGQAGDTGRAAADNRGDQKPAQGSVPLANQLSGKSNNLAKGTVSGGTAQAQSGGPTPVVAHGKTLFSANCQGCHGAAAKGLVGPSLVAAGGPTGWQFADFRQALLKGVTPDGKTLSAVMPRFGAVALQPKGQPASDQDLADLQAYIKTLR